MIKNKFTNVEVRGIHFKLMTYTRSLELCSKMNYETENLDFIDNINQEEVIYDLGACEGRFSIYAALKGIRVISFEPEEKNFYVLSQNIKLNDIGEERLQAFNYGVGEKNGKAIIKIGQPWEGGHQKVVEHGDIRNDLNFNFIANQSINLISIDKFVEEGHCPPPNYLKVDIDGSEMPFLLGAKTTLKRKDLKGIIFELNYIDPNFTNIICILNENGFVEQQRFNVPNEPNLYNIIFIKN
jgi:FkbM family methyltransferase